MGIVGRPQRVVHANVLQELYANAICLKGRVDLAPVVIGRKHIQYCRVTPPALVHPDLVLPVHPIDNKGNPADGTFAQYHPELWVAMQYPRHDHRNEHLVELNRRYRRGSGLDAAPRGFLSLGAPLTAADMEGDRETGILRGVPQRFPHCVPDFLFRHERLELHSLQSQSRAVVQLIDRCLDAMSRDPP